MFFFSNIIKIRTIVINEEWKRLPLAKNYKHTTLLSLIKNFPADTAKKVNCLCQDRNPIRKIENLSIKDYSNQNNALSSFGYFLHSKKNNFKILSNWKPF